MRQYSKTYTTIEEGKMAKKRADKVKQSPLLKTGLGVDHHG